MPEVAIVTDSASDLPPSLVAEHEITVVPLVVRFGAETFLDGQLSIEEFWQRAESGPPPQTSQPPVGAFAEAFDRLVGQGKSVICPVISSRISGTYNAALIAAQHYGDHVTVFDTATWSLLQGYQVLLSGQNGRRQRFADSSHRATREHPRAQSRPALCRHNRVPGAWWARPDHHAGAQARRLCAEHQTHPADRRGADATVWGRSIAHQGHAPHCGRDPAAGAGGDGHRRTHAGARPRHALCRGARGPARLPPSAGDDR